MFSGNSTPNTPSMMVLGVPRASSRYEQSWSYRLGTRGQQIDPGLTSVDRGGVAVSLESQKPYPTSFLTGDR